jgi:hypothetical protein
MEYVRLVHPEDYDHNRGKFNDLVFKNSTDGSGLSVFEVECAENTSITLCAHIRPFYPLLTGDPAIFYVMNESEIPQSGRIVDIPSATGDECHRQIMDVSTTAMKKAFQNKRTPELFYICDPVMGVRALIESDLG